MVLSSGQDHREVREMIRAVRYRSTRPLKMPPPYVCLVRKPGFEAMGDRLGCLREFSVCMTVTWMRLGLSFPSGLDLIFESS